ncbi:MAG: LptF/LptG family permease, partial [Nitrospirota bacterium]|nr:LptF/LptG family permease [Nitrospirota bacterium]
ARLSSDSEITAMKSSGLSLYEIAKPVLVLAIIVFAANIIVTFYLYPWGNHNIKKLVLEASRTASASGIDEGVFYDRFKGATLYVDHIEPNTGEMQGIIIAKETPRGYNVFFAKKGILAQPDDSDSAYFRLIEGSVHRQDRNSKTYSTIDFSSYMLEMTLSESRAGVKATRSNKELYFDELFAKLTEIRSLGYNDAPFIIDLHKRITLPASILIFALIGIPLGIQKVRTARLTGFSISLGLVVAYYVLTTTFEALGNTGRLNPFLAVWGSDIVLALAGCVLFYQASVDKPVSALFSKTGRSMTKSA